MAFELRIYDLSFLYVIIFSRMARYYRVLLANGVLSPFSVPPCDVLSFLAYISYGQYFADLWQAVREAKKFRGRQGAAGTALKRNTYYDV